MKVYVVIRESNDIYEHWREIKGVFVDKESAQYCCEYQMSTDDYCIYSYEEFDLIGEIRSDKGI